MQLLVIAVQVLAAFNSTVLSIGRKVSIAFMALMVVAILIQVFFRYVLNNALPWPDEAARFLMLWMTGLMGPLAYRIGGFVSIEMVASALPRPVGAVLAFLLLCVSMLVLIIGVQLGWNHVGSGWLFNSSSLKLPLDWFGMPIVRVKLAWMYMSVFVGAVLLAIVNLELMIRSFIRIVDGERELPEIVSAGKVGAE